MRRALRIPTICTLVLVLLTLAACETKQATPPMPGDATILGTPVGTRDQAIPGAALTQEKNNTDNNAAATAEIVLANAQATLSSANATMNAAQTQDQNQANVNAAQVAATAEIVHANALATLNSAGSTQSAALIRDAINQTQMADLATTGAEAIVNQQNIDEFIASTQTAVANNIATQTQAGAATSQWYADQARQREEQRRGPITFLWMWCLPIFIVLFAGLVLWGFWRWLRIQQSNQRIIESSVDKLQAPAAEEIDHQDDSLPSLESDLVDSRYQLTNPDDKVRGWLVEIKRKLLTREKDKDDNSDS